MSKASANARTTAPVFSAATRLLVIAPHPDDETIATGLLIQQVRAAGGNVRIVLLTDGDNNPWPQRWMERRWHIGIAERRRWGKRRHAEVALAMQRLDVSASSLQSMGWPDMGLTDVLMHRGGQAVASMAEAIEAYRPNLVVMPSIDDRHPDHGAAHVLVRLALASVDHAPEQWTYLIHGRSRELLDIELHGSKEQQARKVAALDAHRTQMALSGRRMHRLAGDSERFATVSFTTPVSALPWKPPSWMHPWLRVNIATRAGMQSWPWRDAPLRRDERGSYHLVDASSAEPGLRFVKLTSDLRTFWIFDHWGWQKA
ncbi:PIG-L family deacetylase [Rhodanobacter sp. L36]|uniref:PIG-L deacetylase family protein n=1 Tax=Rhodanobacter sp. L36 TaxID=1747221 RepID=UPI00131C6897|nr:PIG-L family deacetylase [Rhodanobacter sp. L36]